MWHPRRAGTSGPLAGATVSVEPLAADVVQFLHDRVQSVTQLEILLAVRNGPSTSMDIARALGISALHATEEIRRMERSRLVERDDVTVSLRPDERLTSTVDELAGLYPRYRLAVTRAIFADA
jgi:DNA-binding HxlR family transcriptional regulator